MGEKKSINHALNMLKGVACIAVVLIHVKFPGQFGLIIRRICSFAVPVFYMISGYFAWNKDAKVIKHRLLKIIRIFCIAYAVYFLYDALFAVTHNTFDLWLSENFTWKTPIKMVFFCTVDFARPVWYLIAMIETYIAWLLIIKINQEQTALKCIPVLFVFQILLTSICETLGVSWSWKINFLTKAMPWFLLGYFFHTDNAEKIIHASYCKLILCTCAGCIVAVIPTAFQLRLSFGVIGELPYALGLFTLCLKNPEKRICKPIEYIGEKLSLYVYILHVPAARTMHYIFCCLSLQNYSLYKWCLPFIALATSLLTAWVAYLIIEKLKTYKVNSVLSTHS